MLILSRDFRRMMEPFTASALQEKKSNKIKDFVSLSGIFNVSHMCLFTRSEKSMSMKVSRLPKGPTLSFRGARHELPWEPVGPNLNPNGVVRLFGHLPRVARASQPWALGWNPVGIQSRMDRRTGLAPPPPAPRPFRDVILQKGCR